MATGKGTGSLSGFESAIRGWARQVGELVSGELRAKRLRDQTIAHLATVGDRPFVGCSPCLASDRADLAQPQARVNPPAVPRP